MAADGGFPDADAYVDSVPGRLTAKGWTRHGDPAWTTPVDYG